MRIGLQTWGSDGDIRPFMALAGGLRSAGHDVTVVITSVDHKDYSQLASSLDIELWQVCREFPVDIGELTRRLKKERDTLEQVQMLFEEFLVPLENDLYRASLRLCDASDILIGHQIVYPLKAAAQKTGRGYATVILCHQGVPSRYLPPFPLPDLGVLINALLWKLARFVIDMRLKKYFDAFRARQDLAPIKTVIGEGWESDTLNLIAVSSTLCPPKPDWEGRYHVCGFFNVPEDSEPWEPSDDLSKFLDEDDPPVYFTFGSMTQMELSESTKFLVEAAMLSGKRAIVQSHWDELKNEIVVSKNIYRIGKTPHNRIFSKCRAVVHHGGAGTTHSAIRAGVPSVVVFHGFDQPFWGAMLKKAGAGGNVLNRWKTTPKQTALEINAVCSSPSMINKAGIIGESERRENGVKKAVKSIEEAFN